MPIYSRLRQNVVKCLCICIIILSGYVWLRKISIPSNNNIQGLSKHTFPLYINTTKEIKKKSSNGFNNVKKTMKFIDNKHSHQMMKTFRTVTTFTNNMELNQKPRTLQKNLPKALTFADNNWTGSKLCRPYSEFINRNDFPLFKFTSVAGTFQIFAHDPREDAISRAIQQTGAFQPKILNTVLNALIKDPELKLIDIGANIGQYCLAAAAIGRDSVAIDAAIPNIEHLCASLHYLNMTNKVTLIYNILSDSNEKRQFRYSKGRDYASIHVDEDGTGENMKRGIGAIFREDTETINSVKLDDILNIPKLEQFKKVFMKIDVEGHEHRVLLGAEKFFDRLQIHGVVMEWSWHIRRPSTANIIKTFMYRRNFRAYRLESNAGSPLNPNNSDVWPQDIIWLPVNNTKIIRNAY